MPMSDYLRGLRDKVGHDLVLLPMVSALVFDAQRRVLLVRHAATELWTAPGGMPRPFETPADAVVRTTWEETGLVVEPLRIAGIFGGMECSVTYRDGDQLAFIATAFEARITGGSLRADDAHFMTRHVDAREVAGLPCYPHVGEMLHASFDPAPTQDGRHAAGAAAAPTAWFRPARWVPPR
jgi:ADP-ribose pyrophosphatase YjhB (NUDIX family)